MSSRHEMKRKAKKQSYDPLLVSKPNLKLMLHNAMTLPRHSGRNRTLVDSVGQYIMRKMGTMGLLTGTQVFSPSQFREKVNSIKNETQLHLDSGGNFQIVIIPEFCMDVSSLCAISNKAAFNFKVFYLNDFFFCSVLGT